MALSRILKLHRSASCTLTAQTDHRCRCPYFGAFTDRRGRTVRRSLGTATKKIAEVRLRDLEKSEFEARDAHDSIALEDALAMVAEEYGDSRNKRSLTRKLISFFGERFDLGTLTRADADKYVHWRRTNKRLGNRGRTSADPPGLHTIRLDLDQLAKALTVPALGHHGGHSLPDPREVIPSIKRKSLRASSRKRILTVEEIEAVLGYFAARPRDLRHRRDFLALAIYTGARAGEVARIRPEDIYDAIVPGVGARRMLHIRGTKTAGSDRHIPVHSQLARFIDLGALALPTPAWSKLADNVRDACEEIGIPPFNAHDTRRTFCSLMIAEGHPTRYVAQLMGHAGTNMVDQVYAQMYPSGLQSAIDSLPVLGGVAFGIENMDMDKNRDIDNGQ